MIAFVDETIHVLPRLASRMGPPAQIFVPLRAHDPLVGPARAADPVAAMGQDIAEIVGTRGCVEEVDLVQRGWTAGEIVEHLPDALGRARHAEAA